MKKNEISALIQLLEDPDKEVFSIVKDKLLDIGIDIIPDLENAWEMNFDSLIQNRAENIIQEIQFNQSLQDLKNWIESKNRDILQAWLILCKYQYPDLNIEDVKAELSLLINEVKSSISDGNTPMEKVIKINLVVFKKYNFKGNFNNFHAPENSFLSELFKTKKGNPLTLCMLFILIGKECQLNLQGVNLPKHFVVGYENEEIGNNETIEFYINPFSQGTIITRQDIEKFLKKENMELQSKYFTPCGNKEIIQRMINNLLHSFIKLGRKEKAEEMVEFLQLIKGIK
jgi:regulator of sirC expression with transglutaminase-like and TPR domain